MRWEKQKANQALRERGKELDRKAARQLKSDMSTVAKAAAKLKPDKLNE